MIDVLFGCTFCNDIIDMSSFMYFEEGNKLSERPTETREQEIVRVRSYLASQAMRRTPEQLIDALREAHQQFLQATAGIPDQLFSVAPGSDEWPAIEVLKHVCAMAAIEEQGICVVIEHGQQPAATHDIPPSFLEDATREGLLATLEASRARLITVVLQADPEAHLDVQWEGSEFGLLNWREWLLFARVHQLDHTRQMQAIATALLPQQESSAS